MGAGRMSDVAGYMREIHELNDRLAYMKADRDRIAAELNEILDYAGHKYACKRQFKRATSLEPCTCGWTAMRERHAKGRT